MSKSYKIQEQEFDCPFQLASNIILGKWKLNILWILLEHTTIRYGALKKEIPGIISHKMLIQGLRELEKNGLVKRTVYPQVPPKVEYSITSDGKRVQPCLEALKQFGSKYKIDCTQ